MMRQRFSSLVSSGNRPLSISRRTAIESSERLHQLVALAGGLGLIRRITDTSGLPSGILR